MKLDLLAQPVHDAFDSLRHALTHVQIGWQGSEVSRARLHHVLFDLIHHAAHALCCLTPYASAGDGPRVLAREALISVSNVYSSCAMIVDDEPDQVETLVPVLDAAADLMAALEPFVSTADAVKPHAFSDLADAEPEACADTQS